jgi:selenoprotein W-related protein
MSFCNTPAGRAVHKPRIEIHYCTGCRWLLRAGWTAQELLTTFEQEIGEVALVPASGGTFNVVVDSQLVWSRHEQGRFPELKQLKQLIRDRIAPDKDLGHSDAQSSRATPKEPPWPANHKSN